MSVIDKKYADMFANSAAWYERGKNAIAGGVTHQSRFVAPFPTYYEWADGPFKYDVDGNEIVDYVIEGDKKLGNQIYSKLYNLSNSNKNNPEAQSVHILIEV